MAKGSADGWPPICTLAELARILTMLHGPQAPTESSLKKWSSMGEFTPCLAAEPSPEELGSSLTREALLRPRRAGRPGLRLDTRLAINRVYELWPHLADTGTQAVLDLAVARVADSFESRLAQIVTQVPPLSLPSPPTHAPSAASNELLLELAGQMRALRQEMAEMKREIAQFSAMRNNLITRLDDAVARAQEAIAAGGQRAGGGADPLVEARRDRDMGVVKSMLTDILDRMGSGR